MDLEGYLAAKEPGTWIAFETARLSEADFLATMFRDRRPVDGPALRAFLSQSYRWVEGMEAVLQDLLSAGAELHAMSNYPVWYHLIEDELGLSRYLHWSFVSWDEGLRKPDRRAFVRAEARMGASPGRILFVDDQMKNVEAAREAGWGAVHFRSASALRQTLGEHGLL
jgi:HAD superfamily hydrolase (TIGR01509 family)